MNVLLAIDVSEASRKAVDHLGRVFGRSTPGDLTVTLLHVEDSLPDFIVSRTSDPQSGRMFQQVADEWSNSARTDGERLLAEGQRRLEAAGIPGAAVRRKLVVKDALPEARKVIAALAIIEEMKEGSYDIVCVGRRGTSAGMGSFLGSVAEKILREAQGQTVWVVD